MSEIKPIAGVDDRVKLSKVIPLNTPFTFNIFPTNVCNFKCNYCAQSLGLKGMKREYDLKPETMEISTFNIAVQQAGAFPEKFKLVSMMGHGEPLVNPNLPEMISMVKKAEIADRIDIITNASLLTREKSRALIDSGLDVIRISLQGLTSERYLKISGVNLDYDEFVSNIAYFFSIRKTCKVFVKIMDISLENGDEEVFYKLFGNITDRMYIEKVKPVYDGVSYNEMDTEINTDRYGNVHEKRYVCPQPFYMLSLWPNGDVTSCDAIYKANTLGNVSGGNLVDMWNSEKLRIFRLLQLKKERYAHSACKRCCAPDDVSHDEDVLDDDIDNIIFKF